MITSVSATIVGILILLHRNYARITLTFCNSSLMLKPLLLSTGINGTDLEKMIEI